jgi:hypothetical protein
MTVRLWVARDSHFPVYFTITETEDPEGYITSWDEPVEVSDDWYQGFLEAQKKYYDLQHELAVKAGYEE